MTRSASVDSPAPGARSDQELGRQFRAIAELNGDIAWIVDTNLGLPTYISPGIASLLGYDMADFVEHFKGKDSDGPLAPLCAGLATRLQRFADGDQSRRLVSRNFDQPHRDGRIVPIAVTSLILVDADGVPSALVGTVRDVSEQRERSIQQRRFTSMLNHEFRTPLSTIDGAIQRLEVTGADADEATRGRYRKIQSAVDRLIGMMDDYLSPERMEALGSPPPADSASPAQLLDEAAGMLRAAGRDISIDIGALPAEMRCQPSGLRLALKVLVDNALQYGAPERAVHLAAGRIGGGIALSVRDGGAGVPESDLGRIFDKHYRGSNARGSGSGLGLYMARSVIEVHGGNIAVKNVAQYGAQFTIWLPAQGGAGKSVASKVINSDNSGDQLQG